VTVTIKHEMFLQTESLKANGFFQRGYIELEKDQTIKFETD